MPLAAAEVTAVSLALARAVAAMHRRGVVHRDISPANIMLRDGQLTLIDFALATTSAATRPEFTHPSEIVGTLPYLAPEQTGRTGRPADQRADLYAIGATLYELATGEPPFGAGDPVRLVHDQLARVARAASAAESEHACRRCRTSSCICSRRSPTTGTRPPTGWSTTSNNWRTTGQASGSASTTSPRVWYHRRD